MNERAQTVITVVGGIIGWLATLSFKEAAGTIAALATAAWFISQTWFLWRRERCTNRNCARRRP